MHMLKESMNFLRRSTARNARKASATSLEKPGKEEKNSLILVKAKANVFASSIVPCSMEKSEMKFSSPDDLRESSEKFEDQIYNEVKVCSTCEKPNALTLDMCNNCGDKLPLETSQTINILYCFAFACKYPVSIRHQAEDVLVFDDLLALSRCHFNAVPTDVHIQDVRFLFRNPSEALIIVDKLFSNCVGVFKRQFLTNPEFVKKTFGNVKNFKRMSDEEMIKKFVMYGFNCPPSQYQLHLQFIVLPLIPNQFQMHQEKKHFTEDRFIPVDYVREVLEKLKANEENREISKTTKIEDLFDDFKANLKIDYKEIWNREYAKVNVAHAELQTWKERDFEASYDPTKKILVNLETGERKLGKIAEEEYKQLVEKDKLTLQNLGRPYQGDKPSLSFYKYPKSEPLREFQ